MRSLAADTYTVRGNPYVGSNTKNTSARNTKDFEKRRTQTTQRILRGVHLLHQVGEERQRKAEPVEERAVVVHLPLLVRLGYRAHNEQWAGGVVEHLPIARFVCVREVDEDAEYHVEAFPRAHCEGDEHGEEVVNVFVRGSAAPLS